MAGENLGRRTVGDDRRTRRGRRGGGRCRTRAGHGNGRRIRVVEHQDAVDVIDPRLHAVLDDDERRAGGLGGADGGVAQDGHSLGVDVGGGLVQADHPGAHRQHAGQRKALLLPAGELGGRVVQRHVQPHQVEGAADALPDFVAGHAEVLGAEGDVVADAGGDHLAVGILQHQADDAADLGRVISTDAQRTEGFAVLVIAEHPGDGGQQRRLARAGRPEQKELFTLLDVDVDVGKRGPAAPRMAPPETLRGNGGHCGDDAARPRRGARGPRRNDPAHPFPPTRAPAPSRPRRPGSRPR